MLYVLLAVLVVDLLVALAAGIPSPSTTTKRAPSTSFVTTSNGDFMLNGKPFFHFGTNAYWLHELSDDDIRTTLQAIKALGISVVRTWAFHDVPAVPTDGSVYFQVLQNGTSTINTGPNGLQRLDQVIGEAERQGLLVLLTLTNNWSALPNASRSAITLPNGFLSNSYGGADAYVTNFVGPSGTHDQFFSSQSLISQFNNYLNVVIPRYASNTTVFGWELANDARCNGTLPSSDSCQTTTITQWVHTVSTTVKNLDPNHLVASGTHGFMCPDCTKLFPPAPPPVISPGPGKKRRDLGPLTAAKVLAKRSELLRKWKSSRPATNANAKLIRGRWAAPATRRQLGNTGMAFDGSTGVDTQDISNVPTVDFSTFQLFPDQNDYMAVQSTDADPVTQNIDTGTAWIEMNANVGATAGKPTMMTGFGVIAANSTSASDYVPFNQSSVTVADVLTSAVKIIGFNQTTQSDAYMTWTQAAVSNGVGGAFQYQWGQTFNTSTSPLITQSPLGPVADQTAQLQTPDDGYAVYSDSQKAIFQAGATQQTAKNSNSG